MRFSMILAGMCLFLVGNVLDAHAQDESVPRADAQVEPVLRADAQDESVVLVQMSFDGGQWSAKPLEILPCGAPSRPDALSRRRSMFQLLDPRGKVLFRRYVTNPRIILVEDPKGPATLLPKMDFTLAVPYVQGASTFQFFEREQDARDDNKQKRDARGWTTADLAEIVAIYEKRNGAERADCQIIVPKPEDPRRLGKVIDTAISIESITSLIARDQHLLIERALELKLDPQEVRQLVYSYRDNWATVRVDEKQVENFLNRYAAAFRDAAKK